jgi:hypothetical protein
VHAIQASAPETQQTCALTAFSQCCDMVFYHGAKLDCVSYARRHGHRLGRSQRMYRSVQCPVDTVYRTFGDMFSSQEIAHCRTTCSWLRDEVAPGLEEGLPRWAKPLVDGGWRQLRQRGSRVEAAATASETSRTRTACGRPLPNPSG